MDKNHSMERRYSFNATRITNPIAESTCLNVNGSSSPATSASTHFRWGGTPISGRNRSSSSFCLSSGSGNNSSATNGSVQHANTTRLNSSHIDRRVYADVQSNGLVSRIVKYHEKGCNLSRSLSVNNLYNKPGQFPIVHLKKNELPHREPKQNLCMTRIPAPEKSMFYGNTLSSILRSNSVVAPPKSSEELSRENRPIMHPPPSEEDMTPTRSVLDVLKEISRKRINSSDNSSPNDATKKYCHRDSAIEGSVMPSSTSNKRQREHMQSKPPPTYRQQPHFAHPQHSPEQAAKKRHCSYNNDISSSLSSSQIQANKRKQYEQKRHNESTTSTHSVEEVDEGGATKRLQREAASTTLPAVATPHSQLLPIDVKSNDGTPQRSQSDIVSSTRQAVNSVLTNNNNKKLTLFNKNYDVLEPKQCTDNAEDADEYAGIAFVKPKKNLSGVGTKNPIIERTQKSKLALMLSGLRGELYDEEEDVVDAQPTKQPVTSASSITTTAATTTSTLNATSASATTSIATTTVSSIQPVVLSSVVVSAAPSATAIVAASNKSTAAVTETSSALPAFKAIDTVPAVAATAATTPTAAPIKPAAISPLVGIKLKPASPAVATDNLSFASKAPPVLGGFAFNAAPTALANSTNVAKTTGGSGGFAFGAPTTTTTTAVPTFAFGAAPATTTTPATTNTSTFGVASGTTTVTTFGSVPTNAATLPTFGLATTNAATTLPSFGSVTTNAATALPSFGSVTTNAATALPSFGSVTTNAATAPPTFGSVTTNAAAALPSFGSATTTATPKAQFSFGADNNNAAKLGATSNNFASPTAFAAPAAAASAPTSSTGGFSFGAAINAQKPAGVATPFTLGAAVNTTTTQAQSSSNTFTFGAAATATTSAAVSATNSFAFGQTAASAFTANNAFSLADNKTSNKTFSFGASTQLPATTFGAPGAAAAPPTAATSKAPAFTFGTNNALPTTTTNGGIFGSAQTTPVAANKSMFNSAAPSNSNNNAFGSSLTFGAAAKTTPGTGATNQFAALASNTKQAEAGFSFGAGIKPSAAATTIFGANSSNVSATTAAPFSFGGASTATGASTPTTVAAKPASNTFSFGSSATVTNGSTNLFDNSKTSGTASPFSFGAAANSAAAVTSPAPNGNLFAPPPSNAAPGYGDRRIRRATRRLQK